MEAYRNEEDCGIAMIWKRRGRDERYSLAQDIDNCGRDRSCARDLDQADIPFSHMKGKIRKCLCNKIIAVQQK